MKENLNDYKSALDINISKFKQLYSGDIISSNKEIFTKTIKHKSNLSLTSTIKCIEEIYFKSLLEVDKRSKEIILPMKEGLNKMNSKKNRFLSKIFEFIFK